MRNFKKTKFSNKGYALIEMLFYISLFAVISILVINSMIVMMKSFKETTILAQLSDGSSIVERISREIRQASAINSIGATNITLQTKDNNNVDKTVTFTLVNSNIHFLENGVLTGNLNSPQILVTGLVFTQITSDKGRAVRLSITIKSNADQQNRTYDFYDTVVLRGSY